MELEEGTRDRIRQKIEELIHSERLELVEFKIFYQRGGWIVRSIVDHSQGGISLEECSVLNKKIVSLLEENDFFHSEFTVEVFSPGLDRPLKGTKDFLRARNKKVGLWFKEKWQDRDYIEGIARDADNQFIYLEIEGELSKIPFAKVNLGKIKIDF